MATEDMDETIRFWRDLMGMRLVIGYGRPGYRQYFFEISDGDMISFFEWPLVRKIKEKDHGAPVAGPFAFDHISFGVKTMDELFSLKDQLEAAGFWVSEAVDHGFIVSVYSFDPNNIPIEFSCPVNEVDVRRHPLMMDSRPSPVALEGSEARPGYWPAPDPEVQLEERRIYPGETITEKKTA